MNFPLNPRKWRKKSTFYEFDELSQTCRIRKGLNVAFLIHTHNILLLFGSNMKSGWQTKEDKKGLQSDLELPILRVMTRHKKRQTK